MAHTILAATCASISELKKNPMGTVSAGEGFPVAILNYNLEDLDLKAIDE
jgi:antitoxin StbD